MRQFLLALQFLTIFPIKIKGDVHDTDIARSVPFFVFIGLIQGLVLILSDFILGIFFHPDIVIAFILLIHVIINGGFHLDGLSDTFDALAVRGDKERKLSVMKDGSTGPAGVIAIFFVLFLKYLSLKGISNLLPFTYYSSLLLMPIIPKWTMAVSMFYGISARKSGLGNIFTKNIGRREVFISTFSLLMILIIISYGFGRYMPHDQIIYYLALLISMYTLSRISVVFFKRHFGGLTGDTLGAVSELTEIFFLITVIIWSRIYF